MSDFDAFMEDMFLGCAFAAFVEEAAKANGLPCPEATRQRAYRYYEEQLAAKQSRIETLSGEDQRS
ncbi:MAG: hypothetical protein ACK526_13560 [Planctomyces sp.]